MVKVISTDLEWHELTAKLEALQSAPTDWDLTCGPLPTMEAIGSTQSFLDALRYSDLLPTRVSPSIAGGVGVTFKQNAQKVYVEFRNTGTVHALFSNDDQEPVVERVIPDSAGFLTLIPKMKKYLYE